VSGAARAGRMSRAHVSRPRSARRWLAALVCGAPAAGLLAASALAAEPLYVIEQLVVNVNSAPDASGERIATVKSGDRVEVIERVRDQVHVRLGNGTEGWIRASYLSADEPLHSRLAQRELQLTQLRADVSRLQGELDASRAAVSAGGAARAAGAAAVAPAASAAEELATTSPATLFGASAPAAARRVWVWVLVSSLLSLGCGFMLGALLLDRHIRRKYGGLRIY
jgi:SH3-like domain-containing protein